MGLLIDGTAIATSANVYVDGTPMNNVYIDGTLVWTKAVAKSWKTAWSGSVFLNPYGIENWDGSDGASDAGDISTTISGNISGNIIQVDGTYYQDWFDAYNFDQLDQITETITATKSTTNPTAMSTYYASNTSIGSYLNKPTYSGSTITLSAYTGYVTGYGYFIVEHFEVTAVYYYA